MSADRQLTTIHASHIMCLSASLSDSEQKIADTLLALLPSHSNNLANSSDINQEAKLVDIKRFGAV